MGKPSHLVYELKQSWAISDHADRRTAELEVLVYVAVFADDDDFGRYGLAVYRELDQRPAALEVCVCVWITSVEFGSRVIR